MTRGLDKHECALVTVQEGLRQWEQGVLREKGSLVMKILEGTHAVTVVYTFFSSPPTCNFTVPRHVGFSCSLLFLACRLWNEGVCRPSKTLVHKGGVCET